MRAAVLLLFLASLPLSDIRAELDLTPFQSFRMLEGVKIPMVEFQDGTRRVSYQPPSGWWSSGSGRDLSLFPPNANEAWMRFVLAVKKDETPPATAVDPQSFAASFLPHEAKDVVFIKQVPSPYTLEGQPSSEFIFKCSINGNADFVSVSIVERNAKERLTVIIMAHAKDFEEIHSQGIGSLFRWTLK